MNRFDQQWQKLITAARQAPVESDAAPYGFATRVAAHAVTLPPAPWLSLERLALRGLALAAVCSVAAFALNFAELELSSEQQPDVYATGTTDTLVDMLDLS